MRNRLVELIGQTVEDPSLTCPLMGTNARCGGCKYLKDDSCDTAGRLADYLLSNGTVVPPVKIGQELWDIHYNRPRKWEVVYLGYNGKEWHINIHWWKDRHNFKTLSITYPFVGKMWYLTKEEAEQALNNIQNGNSCDGGVQV